MTIGLGHYLSVAAILFTLGILGIFINRKNVIVILMSIELILLAVNINLVAFSSFLGDLVGQVFALLVLTVAAAEAAIGLAILVVYYRNRGSIAVEDINLMKGRSVRSQQTLRHARICCGHPRLSFRTQDVDGQDKPGHDEKREGISPDVSGHRFPSAARLHRCGPNRARRRARAPSRRGSLARHRRSRHRPWPAHRRRRAIA